MANPLNPQSSISGQQVGLLGGPIFILYKILGVYRLAEAPEQGLLPGLRPVFWLEGNDADLDEIATFHGINAHGEIKSYRWSPKQLRGQPIGNYLVDEDLLTLYRDYFSYLPSTAHSEDVRKLVFSSYQPEKSILDANHKFFSHLLQGFEASRPDQKKMTWFRSDEEEFRDFSQDILRKEIDRVGDGQCPVFALIDNKREALFKKGKYCYTRMGRRVDVEKATLLPSVWNRNILQDAYWGSGGATYVAGKAEEKYLQEIIANYHYHKVQPAQVIPRMSATIIDDELNGHAHDLSFKIEDIISKTNSELISQLQVRDLNISLLELGKKLKQEKDRQVKDRRRNRGYEKTLYVAMKHRLGEERKNFKEERRGDLARLQHLVNWIHPPTKGIGSGQILQERFHNITTLLNLYGFQVIPSIYRRYEFGRKVICLNK